MSVIIYGKKFVHKTKMVTDLIDGKNENAHASLHASASTEPLGSMAQVGRPMA